MHLILWLKKLWSSFQWLQQTRHAAFDRIASRADQGNPQAQFDLAERYYDGLGTTRDYERSFQHFLTAAKGNHALAQTNAGMMLLIGRGTPRDPSEGGKWILLAAHQGQPKALELLDTLKRKLTPEQRREADQRARQVDPTYATPPSFSHPSNKGQ